MPLEYKVKRKLQKILEVTRVFVVWVECGPWFSPPLNKHGIYIGFCGYSKKPFTVAANWLYPFIIKDIFVDNDGQGTCEEAYHCICTSCPKNKTTLSTLKKSATRWRKLTRKWWENLQSWGNNLTLNQLGFENTEFDMSMEAVAKVEKKIDDAAAKWNFLIKKLADLEVRVTDLEKRLKV